jgi:hypothetical protein
MDDYTSLVEASQVWLAPFQQELGVAAGLVMQKLAFECAELACWSSDSSLTTNTA